MSEKKRTRASGLDTDTQSMIYEGLNITQMEILFDMDIRDLRRKMIQGKVVPCGSRNGADIYRLKDVMPWVVKPLYDVETYIRNMNPSELPKTLSKEYWAAQRSKQEYEFRAGNLWETEKVIEKVGELYKLVKMSATLATDTVERQVELSDKQRKIIKDIMDGMLADLLKTINEKFAGDENQEGDFDGNEEETEEDL